MDFKRNPKVNSSFQPAEKKVGKKRNIEKMLKKKN